MGHSLDISLALRIDPLTIFNSRTLCPCFIIIIIIIIIIISVVVINENDHNNKF